MKGVPVHVVANDDASLFSLLYQATVRRDPWLVKTVYIRQPWIDYSKTLAHEAQHVAQDSDEPWQFTPPHLQDECMAYSYNGTQREAEPSFVGRYWASPEGQQLRRSLNPDLTGHYEQWLLKQGGHLPDWTWRNSMDMIVRPYTGISRKPRLQPAVIGLLHAMRGDAPPDVQLPATENWFLTRNLVTRAARRVAGWGPMADFGIGWYPKTNRVEIMQFGDPFTTRANWSAGFGAKGVVTWGMDEVAIAIELDQSAAMEDYRDETIEKLIELALWLPSKGVHIAPVHLPPWDQVRARPIPTGWLGHDETANGVRLGKSDVGDKFIWDTFIDAIDTTSVPVPEPGEPGPDPGDFAALSLKVIKLERDYNAHDHGPPV